MSACQTAPVGVGTLEGRVSSDTNGHVTLHLGSQSFVLHSADGRAIPDIALQVAGKAVPIHNGSFQLTDSMLAAAKRDGHTYVRVFASGFVPREIDLGAPSPDTALAPVNTVSMSTSLTPSGGQLSSTDGSLSVTLAQGVLGAAGSRVALGAYKPFVESADQSALAKQRAEFLTSIGLAPAACDKPLPCTAPSAGLGLLLTVDGPVKEGVLTAGFNLSSPAYVANPAAQQIVASFQRIDASPNANTIRAKLATDFGIKLEGSRLSFAVPVGKQPVIDGFVKLEIDGFGLLGGKVEVTVVSAATGSLPQAAAIPGSSANGSNGVGAQSAGGGTGFTSNGGSGATGAGANTSAGDAAAAANAAALADPNAVVATSRNIALDIAGRILAPAGGNLALAAGLPYSPPALPLLVGNLDPTELLATYRLISNDGATVISNDGGTLISNDGSTVVSNDGSSVRARLASSLITNDGATLITNDGATLLGQANGSILPTRGGALITNDGATLSGSIRVPFAPVGDAKYRLQTYTDYPWPKNIYVYAATLGGKPVGVTVDAASNFTMTGLPASRAFVVLVAQAGPYRIATLLPAPGGAAVTANMDAATMAATAIAVDTLGIANLGSLNYVGFQADVLALRQAMDQTAAGIAVTADIHSVALMASALIPAPGPAMLIPPAPPAVPRAGGAPTFLPAAGAIVASYPTGNIPCDVTLDSTGNAWISNIGDGTVTKISPTGAPLGTFNVGAAPNGISFDASDNAWVCNELANTVTKLSNSGVRLATYNAGTYPAHSTFDLAGNLWVSNSTIGQVVKIAPSGAIIGRFATGGAFPFDVEVDASTGNIWVTNKRSNTVSKLSPSGTLLGTFAVGSTPISVKVDGAGNAWVTNRDSASVTKLSPTGATLGTFAVGNGVNDVVFDNAGNVWVTNSSDNTVSKLSPTGAVLGTYPAGSVPNQMIVDSTGRIWATTAANTVVVFAP